MTDTNIFETASRKKLRIETVLGFLTVEHLWDLPLKGSEASLDEIAKNLDAELSKETGKSFVDDKVNVDSNLQLAFDLVLHIINVKKAERDKAQQERLRQEKKSKIMEAIAKKEDQQLDNTSLDKLKAMLADL